MVPVLAIQLNQLGPKLLKCRLLGPPWASTSEWHGLEKFCFFKSTAGSQAASRGNFESTLDVEQGALTLGSVQKRCALGLADAQTPPEGLVKMQRQSSGLGVQPEILHL